MAAEWDFADPYTVEIAVESTDIDSYQHVNNAVYLSWFDRVAWSHSAALGVPLDECLRLRRGMAAHSMHIDYLRPAVLGDRVAVATWITATDGRLRVSRRFQVVRGAATLSRASTEYVCIHLDTGRPARLPDTFRRAYRVSDGAKAHAAHQCAIERDPSGTG